MNSNKQEGRHNGAGGIGWVLVTIFTFLLPLVSVAQDCKAIVSLETQTVKAGDLLTIVAAEVILEPGKQFVIEPDGHVALQAAGRIELNYGFQALAGSVLFASMVPCDPGDGGPKDPTVVYPNPTDGILNVKAYYTMSSLRLTDMSGFVLLEKTDINETAASVDISMFKPGFYILEILTGRSVTEAIRIEKK